MIKSSLIEFFERDLIKLKEEIGFYTDENSIWILQGEIQNSAGNLCLHLTGNLKHFIGTTLGNTGYIREREREFTLKNIPQKDLITDIDSTTKIVLDTLNKLTAEDLEKTFPLEKHGKKVTVENMLIHLFGHFNYHLGQINYHRRLIG